jgi:hypothetical protein
MIEIILGFTLGYAVPMFLLKWYAGKRPQVDAQLRSTEQSKGRARSDAGSAPSSRRQPAVIREACFRVHFSEDD